MRNSGLLAMEIIWIATGIGCTIAAIKSIISGTGTEIIIFVLMSLLSFTFAMIRHIQRKKS